MSVNRCINRITTTTELFFKVVQYKGETRKNGFERGKQHLKYLGCGCIPCTTTRAGKMSSILWQSLASSRSLWTDRSWKKSRLATLRETFWWIKKISWEEPYWRGKKSSTEGGGQEAYRRQRSSWYQLNTLGSSGSNIGFMISIDKDTDVVESTLQK